MPCTTKKITTGQVQAYRTALALKPNYVEAWTYQVSALKTLGRGNEAVAVL